MLANWNRIVYPRQVVALVFSLRGRLTQAFAAPVGAAHRLQGREHRRLRVRVYGHDAFYLKHVAQHLVGHHFGGRAAGDYLAVAQRHQAMAEARGLVQIVQHHDDAEMRFGVELLQQRHHVELMADIQEGRGFVE